MTLTTRLTVFGLAALAIFLCGFSVALYLLASEYLYRQTHDRLDAALNVLVASVEVKADGVQWEADERRLAAGEGVAWMVADPEGRAVDHGGPPSATVTEAARLLETTKLTAKKMDEPDGRWLFHQRKVEAMEPDRPFVPSTRGQAKFPTLQITVGTSLEPNRASLRELTAALIGLSTGVWLVALIAGRMVCRWALRPVVRMATAARDINTDELDRRLPVAPTRDEIADLGQAFNDLLERVQEAYERQRSFTAEASHQLRTPLTALIGQVEVALRRDRDTEDYRRVLGAVRDQGERLRRVVESLLFLARADADTALPDRERTDLASWLPRHIRSWADHPRAANLVVLVDGPVPADIHPVLLGELVDVLIDNACKYSPAETPVIIGAIAAGDHVEVTVADNGPGIDPADVPHLFRPFFRSAAARRRGVEGVGLGLAVAARIAVAHGGTLTATPANGGTTFVLRLPRLSPELLHTSEPDGT